jgi:hypothetical protein
MTGEWYWKEHGERKIKKEDWRSDRRAVWERNELEEHEERKKKDVRR